MSITQEQVHAVLKEALDPNTGKDFFTTKSARNVRVEGGNVSLEIELGYPAKTQIEPIRKLVALLEERDDAAPRPSAGSASRPPP